MLFPVALAYLDPNSKKGYFNKFAKITAHNNPKPNKAPALVLWTRWDTPIAVLANKIPGPKVKQINLNFQKKKRKNRF